MSNFHQKFTAMHLDLQELFVFAFLWYALIVQFVAMISKVPAINNPYETWPSQAFSLFIIC